MLELTFKKCNNVRQKRIAKYLYKQNKDEDLIMNTKLLLVKTNKQNKHETDVTQINLF